MPVAHRPRRASILESVDELQGLASKDGRQSPSAARREHPKSRIPPDIPSPSRTTIEQYSQTATEGKAEGDIQRKIFTCSELDSWAEDEYHLNPMLSGPRTIPHRAPEGRP